MPKIVCLGDSLTEGYGVDQKYSWPFVLKEILDVDILNKGISGDTTSGMLSRFFSDVILQKTSHVIITGGTNDIWWNIKQNYIQANIQSMTRQAEHNNIVPIIGIPLPIYLKGVEEEWGPSSGFERCQKKIIQYAKSLKVQARQDEYPALDFFKLFINDNNKLKEELFLDGLHPNEKGHSIMAEYAAEKLKQILAFS